MAKIKAIIISLFVSLAINLQAQTTNLTFTWDYPATITGTTFKLYDSNTVVVTVVGTNYATYPGYNVTFPHTMSVTASNELGESIKSPVKLVPAAAVQPSNLKPIPLSMAIPFNGDISISQDLVNWNQRMHIDTLVGVFTWNLLPNEPMMFMAASKN